MKKKKSGTARQSQRTRKRIPTGIQLPGTQTKTVWAYITGTPKGQAGLLSVTWEVWMHSTCVDRALRPKTHRYDSAKETWDSVSRLMVAKAVEAFHREYSVENMPEAARGFGIADCLYTHALTEMREDGVYDLVRKITWGESTWKRYKAALLKLCEQLDQIGSDMTREHLIQLRADRIEQAAKSKKSKGALKAEESVDQVLLALSYCISVMREYMNSKYEREILPPVPLYDVIKPGMRYHYEQIKWIPDDVLVRLVQYLFDHPENGLIMGIALMLTMGLRTSEACAVKFGELLPLGDNAVRYQVRTQGAERNPVLKTTNAYRDVFAGKLLADLKATRTWYLLNNGYAADEIDQMYAVSTDGDPTMPADSAKLSTYARSLLLLCGYDEQLYNQASQLMTIEPDHEGDGKPMTTVSAYIFRRCFATLLCNHCDLAPGSGVEDYLLGHVRKASLPFDIQNRDIQIDLAAKMERIVLHPPHTAHPLYKAIELSADGGLIDMSTHVAYSFVAAEDVEIEVTVETQEPNGVLEVHTDATMGPRKVHRCPGTLDTPERRANRPVVLMPLLPDQLAPLQTMKKHPDNGE